MARMIFHAGPQKSYSRAPFGGYETKLVLALEAPWHISVLYSYSWGGCAGAHLFCRFAGGAALAARFFGFGVEALLLGFAAGLGLGVDGANVLRHVHE